MGDRTSALNGFPIDWLMEEDNPSVRYFALTGLLDKPESDSAVKAAKHAIMTQGLVPSILAKQDTAGYWGKPDDFYLRSKYKGTVWTLILLARLGYRDERMRDAIDAVLEKQCEGGTWANEDHYGDRYIMRVDKKGRPSKWITLEALQALKLLLS